MIFSPNYYMSLKDSLAKPRVLTEAPKGDDDLSATDYGDMEEVEVDNTTDEEINGDEEKTPEDETEETGEEEPDGEDSTGDEDIDPEIDNTEDESDSGENINEEQPNNDSDGQSQEDTAKNKYLINDFIELYNRLEEIIEKVNSEHKLNKIRDPRCVQSRNNMEQVKDVLYDYITSRFEHENYVFNLYQFNLFIQAINVNIELLSSAFKKPLENNKKRKK